MASARSPLVGREPELAALREALRVALDGVPQTVAIGGEAGIGKSRLVEEFAGSVAEGPLVVRGQCVDLGEDAPPYAPVSGLFRALAAAIGDQALLDAAGPSADALAAVLPRSAGTDRQSGGSAERLYEGVASTLENVAGVRPLVVVIEDLHWADPATLALLRFTVRVVLRGRVLFLLTYRNDEVRRGDPLARWLPELERMPTATRLALRRLDRDEVTRLVSSLQGADPEARELASIFARSDGNPFFVEELVDARQGGSCDDVPVNLRDVLLARYDTLSPPAQRVMRLVAAGGSRVEHDLLQAVYDGDPAQLDDAVGEAVRANLLAADDSAYQFRHALVRDAVHAELLPGERVRFHRAYAAALETASEESGATPEISYHWMIAHDSRSAFRASIAAMEQARQDYAHGAAARMGERALELWSSVADAETLAGRSRRDLLAETAYAFRNAGESERGVALVDEALAETGPDERVQRAMLLRNKASYLANLGRLGSIDLLQEAVELLEDDAPSFTRANVLGELSARLMLSGRMAEAISTADRAFSDAEHVDSRGRMSVALNIRGTSKVMSGDIGSGLADLERAGEIGVGDPSARLRFRVNYSDALFLTGRFEEAVAVALEGTENARRRGLERTSGAILMSNTVEPLFALGQWDRANEVLDRALALEPPLGFSAHLRRLKLWWLLWSGSTAAAAEALGRWRRALGAQLQTELQAGLAFARVAGEISLETGDLEGAWAYVRVVLPGNSPVLPPYTLPLLVVAARTLSAYRSAGRALPEQDAAAVEAALRETLEQCIGWPTAAPHVALFEAELTPGRADRWRAALEAATAAGADAYLTPYTQLRLAEALAAEGARADAAEQARAAAELARRIGAGLIERRALELRSRLGTPTSARPADDRGLTEREQQVLDLVAQGLSNAEIARTLFISPKTASVHVSAILRKLGAASRTEAAYLARS